MKSRESVTDFKRKPTPRPKTWQDELRELAEMTVACTTCQPPNYKGDPDDGWAAGCPDCHGSKEIPDKHFEALRCKHTDAGEADGWTYCQICGYHELQRHSSPYAGLDTSLGAIVRTAAACGWRLILQPPQLKHNMLKWTALPQEWDISDWRGFGKMGQGDFPEEAAARALYAAVTQAK